MSSYKKDMLSAGIFTVAGIILFVVIPLTVPTVGQNRISSRSFPYFIAAGMVVLGLLLGILTYIREHGASRGNRRYSMVNEQPDDNLPAARLPADGTDEQPDAVWKPGRGDELRVWVMVAIIIGYVLLFRPLGYFISSFLASTASLYLLGTRRIRHYLIVYGVFAVLWVCFTKLLFITLP